MTMQTKMSPGEVMAELVRQNTAIQVLMKHNLDAIDKIAAEDGERRMSADDVRKVATRFAQSESLRLATEKAAGKAIKAAYAKGVETATRNTRQLYMVGAACGAGGLVLGAVLASVL